MAAKVYATDRLLLGNDGVIEAGELVPETYVDSLGNKQDTDFARLEELGLISDTPPAGDGEQAEQDGVGDNPDNLDDLKVDQLKALADERGIEVEGTGKDGNVTKADLVAALAGDGEQA